MTCRVPHHVLILCATAILLAPATPRVAHAAFTGGLEPFDGTTLDAVTWEETVPPGGVIAQNGVLTVDGGGTPDGPEADVTTRMARLGIGDTVSVDLLQCDESIGALYLTDDSEGTSQPALFDEWSISLWYEPAFDLFTANYTTSLGQIHGHTFGTGTPSPPPGQPYRLMIVRESSTTATFLAFTHTGSLIDSLSRSFTDIPDSLYVSLMSFGRPVVFDDVRAPVPDPVPGPGGVALAVLAATLLACAVTRRFRGGSI